MFNIELFVAIVFVLTFILCYVFSNKKTKFPYKVKVVQPIGKKFKFLNTTTGTKHNCVGVDALPEIYNWLRANKVDAKPNVSITSDNTVEFWFLFKNKEDALKFKLVWS